MLTRLEQVGRLIVTVHTRQGGEAFAVIFRRVQMTVDAGHSLMYGVGQQIGIDKHRSPRPPVRFSLKFLIQVTVKTDCILFCHRTGPSNTTPSHPRRSKSCPPQCSHERATIGADHHRSCSKLHARRKMHPMLHGCHRSPWRPLCSPCFASTTSSVPVSRSPTPSICHPWPARNR